MTKSAHTPTPWTNNGQSIIVSSDGDICQLFYTHKDGIDDQFPNAKANAAFIVRAVNSHEALVEALELIMKNSTNFRLHAPAYMIDKVEAALKLAKGE